MVKLRNKAARAQKKKKANNPKTINATRLDDLDPAAIAAAKMLLDPCGAELVPSVYPGELGYMARFNSVFTVGGVTGQTCGAVILKPGNNVVSNTSSNVTSASYTIGYADTQAPGAAFLNTNATKVRATGACLQLMPNGAPSNATGLIHYGIVPASSVAEGVSTTFDNLIGLTTHRVNISQALMQPLEVKWSPGTFDDRYSPVAGITSDDDTDRNVILVVFSGMGNAVGCNVRATCIYEWAPTNTIGIPFDSTTTKPSRCDIGCVLRNIRRKDSNWWWSLGLKGLDFTKSAAIGYYTGGPMGAAVAAARYF